MLNIINNLTQGIYDSVPFTTLYLHDMDKNLDLIHGIIDAMPKSLINVTLINVTYVAEDYKAIVNLIFNVTNLSAKDLVYDLYNQVFDVTGINSYTQRVIGNHTYLTCEIQF